MKNTFLRLISRFVLSVFCFFGAPMLSAATFIVNTTSDELNTPSGANVSLREALRDANAAADADTIVFDASLNGATITVGSSLVNDGGDTAGVTIDGSALSSGITVNSTGTDRVLSNGGILTLRALTLTGGFLGTCCGGAAFYNHGSTMTVERCTITGNTAGYGAVFTENNSITTLRQCTISGNTGTAQAGAIYNRGTTILIHCTVSGNTAGTHAGGIYNQSPWQLSLENSIVAGNTATNAPDILNFGTLTNLGVNIVQGMAGDGPVVGSGLITNVNPGLGALTTNGGPTRTMLPLAGSPAIDAAVGSTNTIDQRGLVRPSDGDSNGTALADIGAVEVRPVFTVANNNNSGAGSLRQAILDAGANPGPDNIIFDPSLNGAAIYLGSVLSVNDGAGVNIDASALSNGLTISGSGACHIFFNTGILTLRALTLTGGLTPGHIGGFGPETHGGAILNQGSATLERCTLIGNNGRNGAAIFNESTMILRHCTITRNSAISYYGAIGNTGALTLTHCTVFDNPKGFAYYYEGIVNLSGNLVLDNSIVAASGTDIKNYSVVTAIGVNIVQSMSGVGPTSSIIQTNPMLSWLSTYGGPTRTYLPMTNSPAIDGAVGSTETVDQRGYPRPAEGNGVAPVAADIGAVEVQAADGASLLNLVLSAGSLSPGFEVGTFHYIVSVDNLTTGITVTATAAPLNTNITVNGVVVTSGAASGSIALNVGTNTISILVTGQDGTTRTYTVVVTRAPSSNADLSNLVLSDGNLFPGFTSGTVNYKASVSNSITSITLTPTVAETNAILKVNNVTVASGTASASIPLNPGFNTNTVVVTAQDGVTTKTYLITVRRSFDAVVTTIANDGAGSLRRAILDGAETITFSPALAGETITLTSGSLDVTALGVTIDASALVNINGITIDGNGSDRIFLNDGILTLRAVTLTRAFSAVGNAGGAVLNYGTMTLERCTLSGNTGGYGGALFNYKTMLLEGCTLSGNTGNWGGAIWNNPGATMIVRHCTIAGNTGTGQTGAIESRGTMSMVHCTVASNTSPTIGGIFNYQGALTLDNTIVAGNSGSAGADMNNQGTVTQSNVNIFQATIQGSGVFTGSGTITYANPLLSSLGNYGGSTRTMLPLPGSPVIDAASGSIESTDQRGYTRPEDGDGNASAVADIGAVEVQSSDGAYLVQLALSAGVLAPAFKGDTFNYSAVVTYATTNLVVIPTAAQASATITVNGATVASGTPSGALPLNLGTNIITVGVTALSGIDANTYTIDVIRLDDPPVITLQPVSRTVNIGSNVQFSVAATGTSLNYQWLLNGNPVFIGSSVSNLNFTPFNRSLAGRYSVVITNSGGSVTSSNAMLHLLIPQKLQAFTKGGDGRWSLKFNDANGGLLTTNELGDFEVQSSTNLTQWTPFTNALTLTNGLIHFTEPSVTNLPTRFFRVRSK